MRRLVITASLMLIASACVFTRGDKTQNATFTPPLVERGWQVKRFASEGNKHCLISGGYNAIEFLLSNQNNHFDVAAESTRDVPPGTTFSVRTGQQNYRSQSMQLTKAQAANLLQALPDADRLYLEWNEIGSRSNNKRRIFTNQIASTHFAEALNECKTYLGLSTTH
jgi:hypothetical protein